MSLIKKKKKDERTNINNFENAFCNPRGNQTSILESMDRISLDRWLVNSRQQILELIRKIGGSKIQRDAINQHPLPTKGI